MLSLNTLEGIGVARRSAAEKNIVNTYNTHNEPGETKTKQIHTAQEKKPVNVPTRGLHVLCFFLVFLRFFSPQQPRKWKIQTTTDRKTRKLRDQPSRDTSVLVCPPAATSLAGRRAECRRRVYYGMFGTCSLTVSSDALPLETCLRRV